MNLKEQIKTVISETCTHWLISDDAELKKVSKKLSKEFETIINAEIERRQPISAKSQKKEVIKAFTDFYNDELYKIDSYFRISDDFIEDYINTIL